LGRNVVLEMSVKFDNLVEFAPRVVEVFTTKKWVEMLSTVEEVSPTLVCELYTNMHDYEDGIFRSMPQEKPILISPSLIHKLTSTHLVDDSPYPWTPEQAPSHMEVVSTLGTG
jgi:hypothetical protein